MKQNYTFLGATLNLGVILPKINYKALWELGVAPKLALNDGQNPSFKICAVKLAKLR